MSPILFPLLHRAASLDAGLMLLVVFVVLVSVLALRFGTAARR